jgi:hypothetical protein
MIRPFLPELGNQTNVDPATACRQLSDWEADLKPGSAAIDLLRLQILAMALIAMDCHGLSSIKGEAGGPSKAELLGRAAGLGYSMRLYARVVEPDPNPELDLNSDDMVALRTWYVLVMLDRWNAVGTAASVVISNDSVEIPVGLKHVVGDVVFALLRKFSVTYSPSRSAWLTRIHQGYPTSSGTLPLSPPVHRPTLSRQPAHCLVWPPRCCACCFPPTSPIP